MVLDDVKRKVVVLHCKKWGVHSTPMCQQWHSLRGAGGHLPPHFGFYQIGCPFTERVMIIVKVPLIMCINTILP